MCRFTGKNKKINVLILYLLLVVIFIVVVNGIKAIVLSVITFKMKDIINFGAYSAISNAVVLYSRVTENMV